MRAQSGAFYRLLAVISELHAVTWNFYGHGKLHKIKSEANTLQSSIHRISRASTAQTKALSGEDLRIIVSVRKDNEQQHRDESPRNPRRWKIKQRSQLEASKHTEEEQLKHVVELMTAILCRLFFRLLHPVMYTDAAFSLDSTRESFIKAHE
jgi:hypothetical protein